jgi:hypothetical protein
LKRNPIFLFTFIAGVLLLTSCGAFGFDLAPGPAYPTSQPGDLWAFLPIGYLFTIAVETPVLLLGLSKEITWKQRLFAGVWLTACTYPTVVLVLPELFASSPRGLYLLVAEVFAPVAECALFWLVFRDRMKGNRMALPRNLAVIVLANLLSFGAGEMLNANRWFGHF